MEAKRLRLIMQPITNILRLAVKMSFIKFEDVEIWHILDVQEYENGQWGWSCLCGDMGKIQTVRMINYQYQHEFVAKTGISICRDCREIFQAKKNTRLIKGENNEPLDII